MIKVSVIIPAYNAMHYLPQTVDCVLAQSYTDFEVIIVDDGSRDNIQDWVKTVTDPRLRMISQVNRGKSAAVNRGIASSRGEYLAFLDADDLWKQHKLEKQVACLDSRPEVGLVYTWTALADEAGRPTGRIVKSYDEGRVWRSLILKNVLSCGSTPMVRRSCMNAVGDFCSQLEPAEDWDMWLRLSVHSAFAVIKEPLVLYRKHTGSASTRIQRMHASARAILERAFYEREDCSDLRDRAYASMYQYLGWLAIKNQDAQQAHEFWRKARQSAQPSWALRQLRWAVWLLNRLGSDRFLRLSRLSHATRRLLRGAS
ncbi:MAG: glycosyltransferase family A protein [Cyanobacteria bacterium J06628_6]